MNRIINSKLATTMICGLVVALLALIMPAGRIYALSECQKRIQKSGIHYFNCEETKFVQCKGSGGSGPLVGSENAEKVWNFFISKGFTPQQTAGILGNFEHESGMNPEQEQIGGPAVGLAQWEGGRRTNLESFGGANYKTLEVQLDFVMQELEGPEGLAYSKIKEETDVPGATISWLDYYERAGVRAEELRIQYAEDFFSRFGSGTTGGSKPSSGTSSCTKDGKGQVVGNYSLPTDRSWYDSNPDWFSAPHHDYPSSDIPVPEGAPIYAMHAGTIISAPAGGACGQGVIIEGDDGATYTYCHGSDGGSVPGAGDGEKVVAGQLIMHSSYTGNVRPPGPDGTHLHLGITVANQQRCPQPMFKGIAEGSPPDVNTLPTSGCTYDDGGW